jgi:hypothetical protein
MRIRSPRAVIALFAAIAAIAAAACGDDDDTGRTPDAATADGGVDTDAGADAAIPAADAAPTPATQYASVIHADGRFVAVGGGADHAALAISADGDVFTVTRVAGPPVSSVAHGAGRLVAVGGHHVDDAGGDFVWVGALLVSDDGGATWRTIEPPTPDPMTSITFGAGRFVAVGASGTTVWVYRSADGELWESVDLGPLWYQPEVVHAAGRFVAYGEGSVVSESPDAVDWTALETGVTVVHAIEPRGDELVGVATYDCCFGEQPDSIQPIALTWSDAEGWVATTRAPGDPWFADLVAIDGGLVAVGDGIHTAAGAPAEWIWLERDPGGPVYSVAWDGAATVVAVGAELAVSHDRGASWTVATTDE